MASSGPWASYLNRIAEQSNDEQSIGIFLVEIEVEAVETWLIPRFRVVERPNAWLEAAAALQPAPGLGNLEAFLEAIPPETRQVARSIVEWWTAQPGGSVRYGAKTAISLDRPHPSKPSRPLSHLLLNTDGTATVQRGYLTDAGVVPESDVDPFDEMVKDCFPTAVWSAKQFFLNTSSPPTLDGVQSYHQFLTDLAGTLTT